MGLVGALQRLAKQLEQAGQGGSQLAGWRRCRWRMEAMVGTVEELEKKGTQSEVGLES